MSSTLHIWTIGTEHTASTRLRVHQYLPQLARDGITPRVRTIPNGFFPRLLLKARLGKGDALLVQKKLFSTADVARLRSRAGRLLYDFDDAVHLDGAGSTRNRDRFNAIVSAADRIIAGNPTLAEAANRHASVLPTPIDTGAITPPPPRERDPHLIAWIGSRTNLSNLTLAYDAFVRTRTRHPQLTWVVMADRPPAAPPDGVVFEPWSVPAERALLRRAAFGLMPLIDTPFNRGKCGFKILLYQAAGLCVLASPVGINAGLITDGEDGFLAEADGWERAFQAAVENPGRARSVGEAGRARVERTHSLNALYPRFRKLVTEFA